MRVCTVCGTSEDRAEILGLDIHGQELGCTACIGGSHFPLVAGAIVRHLLSGHAGIVRHVAQHRSRTPYYVEFGERGERAFAARDLAVVPPTARCGTCGAVCKTGANGWARCEACRADWKVFSR